jgi:histidine triad (HIT) family protein
MTIFSKIIKGEIPSHKIAEDEHNYAFLDINPLRPGHTLVVPKREVDYFFDLTDEELASLMSFAKRVAAGIQKMSGCRKVAAVVLGLEVNHAHLHLIPINKESDADFHGEHVSMTDDELEEVAQKIREQL